MILRSTLILKEEVTHKSVPIDSIIGNIDIDRTGTCSLMRKDFQGHGYLLIKVWMHSTPILTAERNMSALSLPPLLIATVVRICDT